MRKVVILMSLLFLTFDCEIIAQQVKFVDKWINDSIGHSLKMNLDSDTIFYGNNVILLDKSIVPYNIIGTLKKKD